MNRNYYDNAIIHIFITNKKKINGNYIRKLQNNKLKYSNVLSYLYSRFNDSDNNLSEIIWRIYYQQEIRNICPICGSKTKFDKTCYKTTGHVYKTYCCATCSAKSEERNNKRSKTCLEKYGVLNNILLPDIKHKAIVNAQLPDSIEKRKATNLERYGAEYIGASQKIQEKIRNIKEEKYGNAYFVNIEKRIITNLRKYGVEYDFQNDDIKQKIKETCLNKYGVDNYWKTETNIKASHSKEAIAKCNNTKRKNHSFNTSKSENKIYELLLTKFDTSEIKREYISELYPWKCDFYIIPLNLYIECNFLWTHGTHPYDADLNKDKYNNWLIKSSESRFYKNALYNWTIRDVEKQNKAKENKLNYIEFFTIEEAEDYINNIIK